MGGALGSVARFLLSSAVENWMSTIAFPWGVFVCNVVGSFVVGLVAGLVLARSEFNVLYRSFLVIGLCGGFTTFSSFSLDTLQFLRHGEIGVAFANITLSICGCLLATYLGIKAVYH